MEGSPNRKRTNIKIYRGQTNIQQEAQMNLLCAIEEGKIAHTYSDTLRPSSKHSEVHQDIRRQAAESRQNIADSRNQAADIRY
jgi:hypothetical protein